MLLIWTTLGTPLASEDGLAAGDETSLQFLVNLQIPQGGGGPGGEVSSAGGLGGNCLKLFLMLAAV